MDLTAVGAALLSLRLHGSMIACLEQGSRFLEPVA
jgi:hypothetical protein